MGVEKGCEEATGKIRRAMGMLCMKEREDGKSCSSEHKAKSLLGCWMVVKEPEQVSTGDRLNQSPFTVMRDAIVEVKSLDDKERLSYGVLGVYKKYTNKWFLRHPEKENVVFVPGRIEQANLKLQLRLLDDDRFGTYCTVKSFAKYKKVEVHHVAMLKNVIAVIGHLRSIE